MCSTCCIVFIALCVVIQDIEVGDDEEDSEKDQEIVQPSESRGVTSL